MPATPAHPASEGYPAAASETPSVRAVIFSGRCEREPDADTSADSRRIGRRYLGTDPLPDLIYEPHQRSW